MKKIQTDDLAIYVNVETGGYNYYKMRYARVSQK